MLAQKDKEASNLVFGVRQKQEQFTIPLGIVPLKGCNSVPLGSKANPIYFPFIKSISLFPIYLLLFKSAVEYV